MPRPQVKAADIGYRKADERYGLARTLSATHYVRRTCRVVEDGPYQKRITCPVLVHLIPSPQHLLNAYYPRDPIPKPFRTPNPTKGKRRPRAEICEESEELECQRRHHMSKRRQRTHGSACKGPVTVAFDDRVNLVKVGFRARVGNPAE